MVDQLGYLIVSAALLGIGAYGLAVKRNAIRILFAVEMLFNAANLNFIAFSGFGTQPSPAGQVAVIFAIGLAAAEAAVGLTIIIVMYRINGAIDVRKLARMKG